MPPSLVNVPADVEWPVSFRQNISGRTYTFRLAENDVGQQQTVEIGVSSSDEVFVRGRPVYLADPIGLTIIEMPLIVYALNPGDDRLRPTKERIRDRDVNVYATEKSA